MNTAKITAFMRQPSTVLGISTLVGTFTAVLTAQLTWQNAIPAIAGALAAIALPDNPRAQVAIKNSAAAVVMAEQTVTNSAKETTTVGVSKAILTITLLIACSFAISARAMPLTVQERAVEKSHSISVVEMIASSPIQAVEKAIITGNETEVVK